MAEAADYFPLHCELSSRNLATVEKLLKVGEDPNRIDEWGNAPLHCVDYEDEEAYKMVQLLLTGGADMYIRDGAGRLPFQRALIDANKKACQAFVDGGFSLEKSHRMRNGTYELLSIVCLFQWNSPYAFEEMKILVDLGVDLTATLSSRGETLLHKAIEVGASIETIQFLIQAGISVNSRNSLGMTPLHIMWRMHYAVHYQLKDEEKQSKIVKLFVSKGYDINSQDIFGRALLHYVTAERGQTPFLQFIIDHHGTNVNIKDRNGVSALHLACGVNTTTVKVMIKNGCLVDIADNNGATVFHYTVFHNDCTMLEYLLTRCTDSCLVSKPDNSGRTPLQWARYFGYVQLIDLFEDFFRSLSKGFERERLPDVFPLRDSDTFDSFKMQEVENMQSEDFSLNTDPNRTLQKLLNSPVIGKLPEIAETQDVITAVIKIMKRVADEVSKTCPLFTFCPEISGSISEETKCGSPDEFDFLCTMDKFSECFQEPTVASSPSLFCRLQIKPDLCLPDHKIMQYVDKDNSLRSSQLILDFIDVLNEAILEKEIWDDISALAPVSNCLKQANNTAIITLKWHGQVYRDLLISVDIVPVLHFPKFWPPNVSESALLNSQIKKRGVHVVMRMYGESLKSGERHFRLSFSLAETKIFQDLPKWVRLSYILAKAVRSVYTCPAIGHSKIETVQEQPSGSRCDDDDDDGDDDDDDDDNDAASDEDNDADDDDDDDNDFSSAEEVISSYFLKNALFTLVNKAYQKEVDLDVQNSSEDQVIIWAKHIYDFIENCLEQEKLPSFFVPGANLLENTSYKKDQHSDVFHGEVAKDAYEMHGENKESEDKMKDHLRKPYIKMLKGILQSH